MRTLSQILGKDVIRCENRDGFLVGGEFVPGVKMREMLVEFESDRRYVPQHGGPWGQMIAAVHSVSGVTSVQRGAPAAKCRYCGRTRKGDACDGCGAPG